MKSAPSIVRVPAPFISAAFMKGSIQEAGGTRDDSTSTNRDQPGRVARESRVVLRTGS